MNFSRALLIGGTLLTLGVVGALVADKEHTLRTGTTVYLELQPVDPRSLIQGDYMRLRYKIEGELGPMRRPGTGFLRKILFGRSSPNVDLSAPEDGLLVIRQPPFAGAELLRIDDGTPLSSGLIRLRYRKRGDTYTIGSNAFYFEEGTAELYENAKFGELRVDADGDSVLVGLLDQDLHPLGTRLEP